MSLNILSRLAGHLAGALRGGSLKSKLVRGAMGSAGVKVASAMLGLVVSILLARVLGAEGYGVYAFAFSLVSLLAVPAQVGLPQLLVRDVAKYFHREQWGLLRGLLRRSNQIAIGISLALVAAAAGVALLLSFRADPVQLETFLWALPLIPLIALGNIRGAALRGLKHVVQGQLPEFVLRPGFLLLFTGGALMFGSLAPESAMALHALAAGLAFTIGSVLLKRHLPVPSATAAPEYETRVWLRSMLPLSLLSGMQIINSQVAIVMLGLFSSSEEVGIYRAASQGAVLVIFVLTAVNMVVAPYISQLYTAGDKVRLQRLATTSARASLLVALPVALVLLVFGEEILVIVFGGEFEAGYIPLVLLSAGQLVNAAAGSVGMLLNMSGHERDAARSVAVATVSNIFLNLLLIPRLGMTGAAIATAVTLLIWNTLLCWRVWVRMGIQSTAIRFSVTKEMF